VGGADSLVALEGDPAPGTGGGTYDSISSDVSINAAGDVAFRANVTGGTVTGGVFVESGGTVSPRTLAGDPAAGTGVGAFSEFESLSGIGPLGRLAFRTFVSGPGVVSQGIYLASGHGEDLVALQFATVPATGGIYTDFRPEAPTTNALGDVVFIADINVGGSPKQGIFRADNLFVPPVPAVGARGLLALCFALVAAMAAVGIRARKG